MRVFDTESARRIIESTLDTKYPPPIRVIIKLLIEACDYIDAIESAEDLQ